MIKQVEADIAVWMTRRLMHGDGTRQFRLRGRADRPRTQPCDGQKRGRDAAPPRVTQRDATEDGGCAVREHMRRRLFGNLLRLSNSRSRPARLQAAPENFVHADVIEAVHVSQGTLTLETGAAIQAQIDDFRPVGKRRGVIR